MSTLNLDEARFLSKAREAEQMAQKARSPHVRDSWLTVAMNYRDLASQIAKAVEEL